MKLEQLYTGCLAHGAYYIESEGEAAIIDPLREVDQYIELAQKDNAQIKYIFETHFHADFVSGHLTLAEKTGAKIVYGPTAQPNFNAVVAEDNQTFKLGKLTIKVLHTPGHTMESSTFLLLDENGKEHAIYTGDTLFLGDVGRPDLAQKAANKTQEELASLLYDSLRTKIMTLPDEVYIYPGHGAGSACGKNMRSETIGILGEEKKTNYALRADMTKEEFIREVLEGLLPPPAYFPLNAQMNKKGYTHFDEVMNQSFTGLSPEAFEAVAAEKNAIVIDTRSKTDFAHGHVPGSIFIGLDGDFAPWVGALIKDVNQPILLVAEENKVKEAITRLARVGFDGVLGYLQNGVNAWKSAGKKVAKLTEIDAKSFAQKLSKNPELKVFDVRKASEYQSEHLVNAENTPLDFLSDHFSEFARKGENYLHCLSGYRSTIAASLLMNEGIENIINIQGGFEALKETTAPKTEYVCPSTL